MVLFIIIISLFYLATGKKGNTQHNSTKYKKKKKLQKSECNNLQNEITTGEKKLTEKKPLYKSIKLWSSNKITVL